MRALPVGYWGIRSYENDDAHDALDSGFAGAHPSRYEELMDDGNPMTFEQVQQELASEATLQAALSWLETTFGPNSATWEDEARLAFVGVVVRHAELRVPIEASILRRAISWLESEDLDWDDETKRKLRRSQELALLQKRISA